MKTSGKIMLIGLLLVSAGVTRGDDVEVVDRVEMLNREIQAIENDLIALEGQRWRDKHEAAYGDPDLRSEQRELKALEGRLYGVKSEYNMRLRVLDETIREQESELGKLFERSKDLELLDQAINRELVHAREIRGDESAAARLTREAEALQEELAAVRGEIAALSDALSARRLEVTKEDRKAGKLYDQLVVLEKEHAEKLEGVTAQAEEKGGVSGLDEKRRDLAERLRKLREERDSLAAAATGD